MNAFTKPAPAPACLSDRDGFAVIGRTKHERMGIRYTNGEGGAAPAAAPAGQAADAAAAAAAAPAHPGAGTPAAGAAPAAATPPAAAPGTPAAPVVPDSQQEPVGGVPFDQLPKTTQDEVKRLRANEVRIKNELKTGISDERRTELGKLLGFVEEAPSADQLASKLGEVTTRAELAESGLNEAKRANMVLLTAPDANANAALLLDSKGFTEKIAGLDPTDSAGIKTAIEAWVKDHPAHALAAPRPGLPVTSGGRQQGKPSTPAKPGLEGAIAASMGSTPQ